MEAIEGGGERDCTITFVTLSLALAGLLRITKCFHSAMQGATLVTFQIISKKIDIFVQSDLKGSKLV